MLRFTDPIPESIDKGSFTQRLGHEIRLWMMSVQESLGGLQGTPDTPSRIEAGVAADPGDSQAAAPSDHIHSIETAAPSVPVALGGSPDEGSGTALMRADATLVLAPGTTPDDILVWSGSAWVSTPLADVIADNDVLNWLDL